MPLNNDNKHLTTATVYKIKNNYWNENQQITKHKNNSTSIVKQKKKTVVDHLQPHTIVIIERN